jgi:hypothetical protein
MEHTTRKAIPHTMINTVKQSEQNSMALRALVVYGLVRTCAINALSMTNMDKNLWARH